MDYSIKVSVENHCSTTVKGNLLETLTAEVMKAQQFSVVKTIRITGMELDVHARHKYTGEEIIVECKAWEENINADVISKLIGNIVINNYSAGWLITTGGLGKDAEGLRLSWEKKPSEERKKLTIYTADRIVELLITNRVVVDAKSLICKLPENFVYNDKSTLFITNIGKYWLFVGSFNSGTIANSVIAFEATSGERVCDEESLKRLKEVKSIYSEYDWRLEKGQNIKRKDNVEFQDIVTVMSGDTWSDYRPSRPIDYVGRKCLIASVFSFFDDVLCRQTNTRLFALKSPSGWGKSSTILKLIDEAKKRGKSNKYFIFAVDVRTALSNRYAELAFKNCLECAIKESFIPFEKEEISIWDITNIVDTDDIKRIFSYLSENGKEIILIFDQFEEIFYKEELFGLFENMRKISNTVDSIKENLIIGYAWKTDFSIASDHPAYYLWSNLKDRRKEFDLLQFSDSEIKGAIKIFGKELGEKINPILARYLLRQCQGYPWLLKKLCIHVYNVVKEGKKQEDAIEQTLNIGSLFESECAELTSQEYGCIKQIAKESPADYFKIIDTFGQDTLQTLINRRTVIKRATKLTLYWDIFRDYVISGKLPEVNIDYIPQVQFSTFLKIISALIENNGKITINILSQNTLLGKSTIDNILIDLVMFGIVYRDRNEITLKENNYSDTMKKIQLFFKRHIVWLSIQKQFGDKFSVSDYNTIFASLYSTNQISDKTKKIYSARLIGWLLDLKLILIENSMYKINYKVDILDIDWTEYKKNRKVNKSRRGRKHNNSDVYWPQVSPKKIKQFYSDYSEKNQTATEWITNGNKKVLEDLISLNAASVSEHDELEIHCSCRELFQIIKTKKNIQFAIKQLENEPKLSAKDLAMRINQTFNKSWSEGTKRVTGGMIYRWGTELM